MSELDYCARRSAGVDVVVCLIAKDDAFANVKTGETAVVLYRG